MILGNLYKAIETEVDIYRIENNAFRVSCEHTQIFIGLNAAAASGNQIFYCIFNIKNPAFVLLTEKCVSLIRKLPSCISATTPPVAWLAGLGLCVFSSATNRLIGEVVQSWRRPLLRPSPGWKGLLALSHLRHYANLALTHSTKTWNWDADTKVTRVWHGSFKNLC